MPLFFYNSPILTQVHIGGEDTPYPGRGNIVSITSSTIQDDIHRLLFSPEDVNSSYTLDVFQLAHNMLIHIVPHPVYPPRSPCLQTHQRVIDLIQIDLNHLEAEIIGQVAADGGHFFIQFEIGVLEIGSLLVGDQD